MVDWDCFRSAASWLRLLRWILTMIYVPSIFAVWALSYNWNRSALWKLGYIPIDETMQTVSKANVRLCSIQMYTFDLGIAIVIYVASIITFTGVPFSRGRIHVQYNITSVGCRRVPAHLVPRWGSEVYDIQLYSIPRRNGEIERCKRHVGLGSWTAKLCWSRHVMCTCSVCTYKWCASLLKECREANSLTTCSRHEEHILWQVR